MHLNMCNLRTSEVNIYSLVIKWVRRNRSKPMTFIQFVDTHVSIHRCTDTGAFRRKTDTAHTNITNLNVYS